MGDSISLEGWIGISVGILFIILLIIGIALVISFCLRNREKKEDRKTKLPSDLEMQRQSDKKAVATTTWAEGGESVAATPSKVDRKYTEQTESQFQTTKLSMKQ